MLLETIYKWYCVITDSNAIHALGFVMQMPSVTLLSFLSYFNDAIPVYIGYLAG